MDKAEVEQGRAASQKVGLDKDGFGKGEAFPNP
jgi:hypothetical protein